MFSDVLLVSGGGAAGLWGAALLVSWRNARQLPWFESADPPPPVRWPKVSLLVAACNEEPQLAQSLPRLLAEDYPELQLIAVDDRSADGSGALLQRLAQADRRLLPLRVDQLPPGWLGKVHALEQARRRAEGEWLLFTDADVHFSPGTVRRAIALALQHDLDHLALFPRVIAPTFWLRVAVTAFALILGLRLRPPYLPQRPGSPVMGVGAFNLVRRAALEQTEGLAWLKMDAIDDCALALLLRRHGAKSGLVLCRQALSVVWYDSLPALFAGFEKSALAVYGYRALAVPLSLLLTAWLLFTPPAALLALPAPAAILACAVAALGLFAFAGFVARRYGQGAWPALLLPVGLLLMQLALLRGACLAWWRGGARWRGTLYPLDELRRQCRFRP